MLKNRLALLTIVSLIIPTQFAQAKEFPVNARFFVGGTPVAPKDLNDSVEPQGIKKIDLVTTYGLEATYPVLSMVDVGVRYTKKMVNNEEDPIDLNTEYSTKIDQDAVLLLARVPFVKTGILRVDAFAGVGGTNTTVKVKTASQDGELTKKAGTGWFAAPYAAAGVSAAAGYKNIYFVVEGGFESNKVDSFDRSGTVSASIKDLDLSGTYFTIGLMIDGLPGSTK